MQRPKLSILDLWVVTAIVAFDCIALDWAILDREAVLTIRGILFPANVLALGLYRFISNPGSRSPFLAGFLASGAFVSFLYFDSCQMFPEYMLRTQGWALRPLGIDACHIHFLDAPSLGITGSITARSVTIMVVLAPLVTAAIALPHMLLALVGGLLFRWLNQFRSGGTIVSASGDV